MMELFILPVLVYTIHVHALSLFMFLFYTFYNSGYVSLNLSNWINKTKEVNSNERG